MLHTNMLKPSPRTCHKVALLNTDGCVSMGKAYISLVEYPSNSIGLRIHKKKCCQKYVTSLIPRKSMEILSLLTPGNVFQ